MNEIDLSKYKVRTDLVVDELDNIKTDDLEMKKNEVDGIKITTIDVKKEY